MKKKVNNALLMLNLRFTSFNFVVYFPVWEREAPAPGEFHLTPLGFACLLIDPVLYVKCSLLFLRYTWDEAFEHSPLCSICTRARQPSRRVHLCTHAIRLRSDGSGQTHKHNNAFVGALSPFNFEAWPCVVYIREGEPSRVYKLGSTR